MKGLFRFVHYDSDYMTTLLMRAAEKNILRHYALHLNVSTPVVSFHDYSSGLSIILVHVNCVRCEHDVLCLRGAVLICLRNIDIL